MGKGELMIISNSNLQILSNSAAIESPFQGFRVGGPKTPGVARGYDVWGWGTFEDSQAGQ
jgi:hypothetical protein